jgi:hypothetical protein
LVAALLLAAASGAAFGDELTDGAKRLLEQRRAKEAYELLLPQESARAGDIEFDYLLGIAANDAGEHERAVFALERVLALQPQNHLARAEIARAYLALGEREAARREFETVRSQSIPAEAKATIERFLAAIRAADTTRVDGFIELGFGYDTNVNSATASSQVTIAQAVPFIGGQTLPLDPVSRQREDTFAALAGGLNVTHKLSDAWALIGAVAGSARLHPDESQFDQMTLDGSLGARWSRVGDAVTLGAQLQSFELDYARNREVKGLVAQWQRSYDERRQDETGDKHLARAVVDQDAGRIRGGLTRGDDVLAGIGADARVANRCVRVGTVGRVDGERCAANAGGRRAAAGGVDDDARRARRYRDAVARRDLEVLAPSGRVELRAARALAGDTDVVGRAGPQLDEAAAVLGVAQVVPEIVAATPGVASLLLELHHSSTRSSAWVEPVQTDRVEGGDGVRVGAVGKAGLRQDASKAKQRKDDSERD